MVIQGAVISVSQKFAVVMTDEYQIFRVRMSPHFRVGLNLCISDQQLIQIPAGAKRHRSTMRQFATIAASLILITCLGFLISLNLVNIQPTRPVAAIVTIDINPSVKLSVTADGQVVKIEALNADAGQLDLNRLIGKSLDMAVESVVKQATSAGFINPADGILDFVVVSTVDLDEETPMADCVQTMMDRTAGVSRILHAVNLVLVEATSSELQSALDTDTPLGLLAIGKDTGIDVQGLSVRSFFADQSVAEKLVLKENHNGLLNVVSADPSQNLARLANLQPVPVNKPSISGDLAASLESGNVAAEQVKSKGKINGKDIKSTELPVDQAESKPSPDPSDAPTSAEKTNGSDNRNDNVQGPAIIEAAPANNQVTIETAAAKNRSANESAVTQTQSGNKIELAQDNKNDNNDRNNPGNAKNKNSKAD